MRLVCRMRNQVGAVVHRDLRLVIDRRQDVAVIRVVVLALDGEDGNVVIAHQAEAATSSCVDSGFEAHSTTSAPPSRRQMARFAVSAVTCRQAETRMPCQRLVLDEFLADDLQHFHGLVRPLDAFLAQIRQFNVLDVAIHCCG